MWDNLKRAWRWYSVQVLALLALLPVVWMELPADWKAMIPDDWNPYIVALIAIGGIVARAIPQDRR